MQIFPAIDLRGGKCVRLRQGDYAQETVFGDDPVAMARRWRDDGAEWLHLVDLDGAKAGQPVNHGVIARIVEAVGIPCQVGGGLRDEASIRLLLEDVGVQRVILGTAALKQPQWFAQMTGKYPDRLCLGLDARNSMVATEGWLDVSQTSALDLARQFASLPVGAIIYTNIANDGMMQGIDPGTLADLAALADLGAPVIASGGVTTAKDLHRLRAIETEHPQLNGAIVGRALYEGTLTLPEAIAAGVGQAPA
ncbi:MAG: 1-(5-phosphoribosyl)-5-[(5-phosphoribosylamino)methylideneamino]imidazole-4-carboxamide isomerase [Planctomycetaceae bacterium]|nr:1-(5-phosphoribosyl)-5-[(5-phosphoribosylamino)methylideneamino]imidazole-4-carboxamide isomerase [Planctomycetaceae bacterium]